MKKIFAVLLVLLLAACNGIKEKSITIEFQTNGAGVIENIVTLSGTEIDLPNLNKTGYSFGGWQYEDMILTNKARFNDDAILYARWTKLQYTVNFYDSNNILISSVKVNYGEKASSPIYPEKEGKAFVSWDKDFSNVTSNLDIYPLFEDATSGLVFELVDNEYHLTSYNGEKDEIIVPSMYKGIKVSQIADDAFNNNLTITKIHLPETITIIGKRAFYNCLNLSEINFPIELDLIDTEAFYSCDQLSEIVVSAKVIGESAFHTCSNLHRITLLDSVEVLSAWSFYSCSRLGEIYLPDSIKEIDNHVFSWCRNLVTVYTSANKYSEIQDMLDNITLIYLHKNFHLEVIKN